MAIARCLGPAVETRMSIRCQGAVQVSRFPPHAAPRMLEAGIPLQVVGTLMGWSAATMIRMAKRYAHIGEQSLRNAVNTIAAAAKKLKPQNSGNQAEIEAGSFDNPFDPNPSGNSTASNPNKEKAPQVGLEPTTLRLTAGCSAIELLRSRADREG